MAAEKSEPGKKFCPFSGTDVLLPEAFSGGNLLTDPDRLRLPMYKMNPLWNAGTSQAYGCLDLSAEGLYHSKSQGSSNRLPNVNDMLKEGLALRRIATGDNNQPLFHPREVSESEFRRSYVKEALHLGREHNMTTEETEKVVLGLYSIEGLGRSTRDMQAGTSFKLTDPAQLDTPEMQEARRSNAHPLSTAVGYNQLIIPTDLHLIHDDGGAIAARLRENGKGTERASELEEKAKLFEALQGKLHEELLRFASKDKNGKAKYLDPKGSPNDKLYTDFAKSQEPTSVGITGRQFSSAYHAMLLDGDIGPILQSRQVNEDIENTLGPEFKSFVQAKTRSHEERARAIDQLLENAACQVLDHKQMTKLEKKVRDLAPPEGEHADHASPSVPESPLSQAIHALKETPLGKMFESLRQKISPPKYGDLTAAGAETCNLLGKDRCQAMFKSPQVPTRHFVGGAAYRINAILHNTNPDQLMNRILLQMSQKRGPGSLEFEKYFHDPDIEK